MSCAGRFGLLINMERATVAYLSCFAALPVPMINHTTPEWRGAAVATGAVRIMVGWSSCAITSRAWLLVSVVPHVVHAISLLMGLAYISLGLLGSSCSRKISWGCNFHSSNNGGVHSSQLYTKHYSNHSGRTHSTRCRFSSGVF